jgi:hypothetical protein
MPETRTTIGRWLLAGHRLDEAQEHGARFHWRRVLWLTGVDYFSTLGYQPGIALLAAGALAPLATVILIAVTLFGAVPVYIQVARRSYAGQGSIAMLESLLPQWYGKALVLGLLGFAATDFVITMTLSAADAATHAVEDPLLRGWLGDHLVLLTLALLAGLAIVFLFGFGEAIRVAAVVAVPYLVLNLIVLGRGLFEIARRPDVVVAWRAALAGYDDWSSLFLAAVIVFPQLALGLSGFETGVSVMPLVAAEEDAGRPVPHGRIRATARLLITAAVIMSFMLLLSSVVTAALVPRQAYAEGGPAAGRAIAWLAHELLGHAFGTVYDLWTCAILAYAGASALAGLLALVPRYMPRFGMAPEWAGYRRPMVLVLFTVCVVVTLAFRADVEAQGGAYATGVLVLMLSAAFAVALAFWRQFRDPTATGRVAALGASLYFWGVTGVFAFTLADNVILRPDGVIIASIFVVGILGFGAASRYRRSTEFRVSEFRFVDPESETLWRGMVGKMVNLVPLSRATAEARAAKAAELRRHYTISGPLAFLNVNLIDNRSEFLAPIRIQVTREREDYGIEVHGAIAIANTIAFISERLDPKSLFLGLTGRNLMTQSLRYLLLGEGEVGLMVYRILLRHWESTPEADIRPQIFMMSDAA